MEFCIQFVIANHLDMQWHGLCDAISTAHRKQYQNSSPPSAAYMRQWIGSALAQIMACRLFGTKPLSKPILVYCHLTLRKKTFSETLFKRQNLSFTKMHMKISSAKWPPFCSGGDELSRDWCRVCWVMLLPGCGRTSITWETRGPVVIACHRLSLGL